MDKQMVLRLANNSSILLYSEVVERSCRYDIHQHVRVALSALAVCAHNCRLSPSNNWWFPLGTNDSTFFSGYQYATARCLLILKGMNGRDCHLVHKGTWEKKGQCVRTVQLASHFIIIIFFFAIGIHFSDGWQVNFIVWSLYVNWFILSGPKRTGHRFIAIWSGGLLFTLDNRHNRLFNLSDSSQTTALRMSISEPH